LLDSCVPSVAKIGDRMPSLSGSRMPPLTDHEPPVYAHPGRMKLSRPVFALS
jgi:hypothetical protein